MTVHTIQQSRNIITKNFKLLEKLLAMTDLRESKSYLQNLTNHLENPDLKLNNLIAEASKLLKNNKELSKLVKNKKLSYDTILEEGVKLLQKNENIQNIINEITEDEQVIDKHEKIEQENLLKFIEKTQYSNLNDMTQNIYEYFHTYPTKERIIFPDGTIVNMTPDEPAVDEKGNILPLIDGIPQGEEATRIITQNTDTGVIIASPPGLLRSYFITRYGSPKVYGNKFNKYQEFRKIVGIDFSNDCFLKEFGCEGVVQPIICMDLDSELMCCEKHHGFNYHLLNMNIASMTDLSQFFKDRVYKYLTDHNQISKLNLIKKIKIILNLAINGRLKNRQLDSDFKLFGIHYYGQYSITCKKRFYGWALVYYSIEGLKKKICHIYLDELTNDINVLSALSLFTNEILLAKYSNDFEHIHNFITNKNKENFDNIIKCMENSYKMNMSYILNKLLVEEGQVALTPDKKDKLNDINKTGEDNNSIKTD
jgi:hypothetical protein